MPQNSLGKPATDKLTELRRLRREQEQRVQKIQRLTVKVVADFRRSGDALYMQYRFTDALASYEKALLSLHLLQLCLVYRHVNDPTGIAQTTVASAHAFGRPPGIDAAHLQPRCALWDVPPGT